MKTLLLGAGGGNDIFSCMAAAAITKPEGEWDIAGVYSPFHVHTGSIPTETEGVFETTEKSKRIPHGSDRAVMLIDAEVVKAVAGFKSKPGRVLGVSLSHGSRAITNLCKAYDKVYLVDVGGDVFYTGPRSHSAFRDIISPMFDALSLVGVRDSNVPSEIIELGPCTDGELPARYVIPFISVKATRQPLVTSDLQEWMDAYDRHIRGVRAGNTVRLLIEALHSDKEEITADFSFRAHLGDRKWYSEPRTQVVPVEPCRSAWFLPTDCFSNPLAITCDSAEEWVLRVGADMPMNCEANVETIMSERFGRVLLATPTDDFKDKRGEILDACHEWFLDGRCDAIACRPSDADRMFQGERWGGLNILSNRKATS